MRDSIYRISLDIHNETPQVQIVARKNDSARRIFVTFMEHGKPYELNIADARAVMSILKPDGTRIEADCDLYADGHVVYDFTAFTADVEGICDCTLSLLDDSEEVVFSPHFTIYVTENAHDGGGTFYERVKDAAEQATVQYLEDHPVECEIIDGAVTTGKLADEAVTTEKLADGAVTTVKLSDELKLLTLKDYVTPQMYGATGDGETDDTDAFLSAIASGKDIFIPSGEYLISRTLTVRSGISIIGENPETTKLVYSGDAWKPLETGETWRGSQTFDGLEKRPPFLFELRTYYKRKPTIKNLKFVGSGNNGLFYINCTDSFTSPTISWGGSALIENVYADNFLEPFHAFSAFQLRVQDSYFLRCGTSYFDYNGNSYQATRFCNCCLFENDFFINENDASAQRYDMPIFRLIHTRNFVFTSCQFQGYDVVIHAPTTGNDVGHAFRTSFVDCWFENLKFIAEFPAGATATDYRYLLMDVVRGTITSGIGYTRNRGESKLPEGGMFLDRGIAVYESEEVLSNNSQNYLIHKGGTSLFPRPYLYNVNDIFGSYFFPYQFDTNKARILLPFNTSVAQNNGENSISISLGAPNRGAAAIVVIYDMTVFALLPSYSDIVPSVFLAKFSVFKFGTVYHIGEISVVKATGYAANATLTAVIHDPEDIDGRHLLDCTLANTSSQTARKMIVNGSFCISPADTEL